MKFSNGAILMKTIKEITQILVLACGSNPLVVISSIFMFFVAFTFIEAQIERLWFGVRFEHFLDPVFSIIFSVWGIYGVYLCAVMKS